jgi:hypothetical protein
MGAMMSEIRALLDDIFRLQGETQDLVRRMCGNDQNLLDTMTQLALQMEEMRLRLSALERAMKSEASSRQVS